MSCICLDWRRRRTSGIMLSSKTATREKAKAFVRAVSDLHDTLKDSDSSGSSNPPQLVTTSTDDLVALVERLLHKQNEFKAANVCCFVDIGFHNTQTNHLATIQTHGLLTLKERTEKGIVAKHNGSTLGDGVYTVNSFVNCNSSYGPVSLLVARLKGPTSNAVSDATFVDGPTVVLRSSEQCVPLVQFTMLSVSNHVLEYERKMQSLINVHFNGSSPADLPIDKMIHYVAPDTLGDGALEKITMIKANKAKTKDSCAICHDDMSGQALGKVQRCGHQFHYECILEATEYSTRCPLCSVAIVEPQGKMPSGMMIVQRQELVTCGGYAPGTIQIDYRLDGGTQKMYHRYVRRLV
jgi:hypothetical protein